MKKKSIWILAVCLAVVLALIVANAAVPAISEEEVKTGILTAIEPQLKELEQIYGVENVVLEVEIDSLTVKKPSLFEEGLIQVTITDYLRSDSFTELEGEEIDRDIHRRYLNMGRFLCYDEVALDGYAVRVQKSFGAEETHFSNSLGNRYHFDYVASSNSYKAYKDGGVAYSEAIETPEDDRTVCYRCMGTGKVKLNYGKSWSDEPGYAYGSECGACGGTGYR